MRIATWNINGLRSGFKEVGDFLVKYDVDILALQEIKVHLDDLTDEIKNIDGYNSFFFFAEKKGYSGTAFYTKIKPESIKQGIGNAQIDREGRVLMMDVAGYKIINFYFPHSSRDLHRLEFKMEFNEQALKFIKSNYGDNVIICGDLNVAHEEIDLARPKQNKKNAGFTPREREFLERFLSLGLVDAYRKKYPDRQEFTWWGNFHNARARNIGWRIDYFLLKQKLFKKLKNVEILSEITGSDHCPVLIEL